jgi:DNA segregation ATPase FtsK/SpoIIIE-like protein
MEGANVGPRVTQYTLKPPTGVKLTKITALESNLSLDLAAQSIRIEAPIPGKRAVGIEVPNVKPAMVRVSSLFQSSQWRERGSDKPLAFGIGKDILPKWNGATGHSLTSVSATSLNITSSRKKRGCHILSLSSMSSLIL